MDGIRLWIFLSVIYLFAVVGFAIVIYNEQNDKITKEWVQETIRLALPKYREHYISVSMTDLKELLNKYNSESKLYYELKNSRIDVKLLKDKYTIKLIEEIDFKLRRKPRKNFTGKTNFSDNYETEEKGKILEFPININLITVIDEVKKNYGEYSLENGILMMFKKTF